MSHPYTPYSERLSRKLNLAPPWSWVLDRNPFAVFVLLSLISPVTMWIFDIMIVHGRFIPLHDQWLSAQFDFALAAAAAILVFLLKSVDAGSFPKVLRRRRLQVVLMVAPFAYGMWHVYNERHSIPSLERRAGINSLYHNLLLYPFLGFTLLILLAATIGVFVKLQGWRLPYVVGTLALVLLLIVSWVWAGNFDGAHPYTPAGVHKSDIANPTDPWCGGLLTEPICGPPDR